MSIATAKNYLLQELIHKGGFARTYLATNSKNNSVVFRVLRKRHFFHYRVRHRFELGIQRLRKLNHPAIVTYLDQGYWNWRPFVVLEFVDGKSLQHWINGPDNKWREHRYVILYQMASALQYLHSNDLLYLDLKPENILLSYHGEVKLTDFDLACPLNRVEKEWRNPAGTPGYLAPEISKGKLPSKATDLYAFGLLIRLLFPEKTGTDLDPFAATCLLENPEARPQNFAPVFDTILLDDGPPS